MTSHSLALRGEPLGVHAAHVLQRSLETIQGGARLAALILTLWLRTFRAGGLSALAKAVVWTLVWPLWLVYLIAFVGVRL